ncbi:non-hydrolyzing UDP-N-acetylglucosamine 2-epimerase [Paucibacter sp. Y2R2-4]|uniref:non-hydrolyzing UDP-N-acetylglucosamine 2-epimerase n=1 Tax=Paucibacter sp. Y2R2-4 TaxID=2893553 RepID=UPI0021E3E7C6|nr:UDP-N-acetylglucosamine 2-epimerase (non-hydrolyzing) [Paucibacter sp. Y2R2-4]MCV2349729.1 UDP-N-acetylglucosamine 2-epimerase (non-hydrolyzing) [Paucibacter sp. Y2R2-4]
MLKILTVVGARPQFIKAAAISRAIRNSQDNIFEETLLHTGQHHDENMSSVFFDELKITTPKYNLEISGGLHGAMTGKMLDGIEKVLIAEKPDWVLIYGDTNSTLAAALAAAKLHIPVAHIEAGLRSFNMRMPEEVNRIVADRLSTLLLCPTKTSVDNLRAEGKMKGVHLVGDVMYDVSLYYRDLSRRQSDILERLGLAEGQYVLATCHRAENTDVSHRLRGIVSALAKIAKDVPVILPLHPRTRKLIAEHELESELKAVTLTDPLPFLDMVRLEQSAKVILTDSGGVQKEAFFYGVPCITMRDETEWTETVNSGWNTLTGAEPDAIVRAFQSSDSLRKLTTEPYGTGNAAELCLKAILQAQQAK